MNKNLNLVELLKDCPNGTKLYSPICGEVVLLDIDTNDNNNYPIEVGTSWERTETFTSDGRYNFRYNGECVLFPSRNQRDWSKFKAPVKKFDYSTLKPFDKVLVRNENGALWQCALFTCIRDSYMLCSDSWYQGIPYNDETKHLAGTSDMPDEKYIWWKKS